MLATVPNIGDGAVRCVFATDHSPYATQAFERFLSWHPRGLEEISVFSALGLTDRLASATNHRTGSRNDSHDARTAAHSSECLANYLNESGYKSSTRLYTGHVPHSIDHVMRETEAELLIVGAQGAHTQGQKGFGSVTTSVLEDADYSVLVLQA